MSTAQTFNPNILTNTGIVIAIESSLADTFMTAGYILAFLVVVLRTGMIPGGTFVDIYKTDENVLSLRNVNKFIVARCVYSLLPGVFLHACYYSSTLIRE